MAMTLSGAFKTWKHLMQIPTGMKEAPVMEQKRKPVVNVLVKKKQ
jgi:hypothetical protein